MQNKLKHCYFSITNVEQSDTGAEVKITLKSQYHLPLTSKINAIRSYSLSHF